MSYILEALKKIEQKRAQEESLKPISFYEAAGQETRKRPLWPILLIAVLVLNAGLLFWWISFKGAEKNENQPKSLAKAPTPPPAALKGPGEQLKAIKKDLPALRPAPVLDSSTKKKETAAPRPPEEKVQPAKPIRAEPTPSLAKESTLPEKAVNIKKSNKVVNIEDLPDGVKKNLPGFKVSTHVYGAEPEGRLIRINDKTLQEGQEVAPGIKVEEIIQSGAILSYQGFRFRIGLKD
jgi:general secretion pathway protein B